MNKKKHVVPSNCKLMIQAFLHHIQYSPHKLQSLVPIPIQNFVLLWVCETGVFDYSLQKIRKY